MIEQTEMVVSKWIYNPPLVPVMEGGKNLTSTISLDVMRKRAPTKKGIACRFTTEFIYENELLLEYSGEHSYVIDLDDVIDKNELHTMIKNTYSMFKEKFDFRKLNTVLQDISLLPYDENQCDLDNVLEMLR
jgi:hypothetical protein